ncbi:cytochrome c oxidase assembly protein [Bacillus sp. Marseille-Q1617]|uniref:cytochrome c oxidase assembly protein n=1 Tax=Bacillus sp. Marseille-Q1617 TaxID=2736887 RepID=UPI00158DB8A3|nr:cytochrome c oxidase assembly protein [Bacillus sp. Marseille-Q1617]
MSTDHVHEEAARSLFGPTPQLILAIPFICALILYVWAVILSNRHYKKWPLYRTVSWSAGVFLAVASVASPLAEKAHHDFQAHMLGHLFLGMLAPLLMALAAPMTLTLRTLPRNKARTLSRLLKTRPLQVLNDPFFASIVNIGGLWLLYTTSLYSAMHQNIMLHIFIHLHVFLAGYLFTVSLIYIDPIPHRKSYAYRAAALLCALAAHGILSKIIYARPPEGVPVNQAEAGSMLMYYGGDAIDMIIIFILCLQWYKASRPKPGVIHL